MRVLIYLGDRPKLIWERVFRKWSYSTSCLPAISAILKIDSGVMPSLPTPAFRIFIISFFPFKFPELISGLSLCPLGVALRSFIGVLEARVIGYFLSWTVFGVLFRVITYWASLLFFASSSSIIIFCFMILSLRTLQKSLNCSRVWGSFIFMQLVQFNLYFKIIKQWLTDGHTTMWLTQELTPQPFNQESTPQYFKIKPALFTWTTREPALTAAAPKTSREKMKDLEWWSENYRKTSHRLRSR